MFICWSTKGGTGTTVVSAAFALVSSKSSPTVLVDLGGDSAAALGLPEPPGPGAHDWLQSSAADADALQRLLVPATDRLFLLPCGNRSQPVAAQRWADFAVALAALPQSVVVDAGPGSPATELLASAAQSVLVTRQCYLALRRVVAKGPQPTGVVLVTEPGRALTNRDVEHAVGAPVVAEVPWDPAISRAVDAGMLASRMPRSLALPLQVVR
jgi:MinD-like ATPase involved in chromosome partitioning or flagellar assembly